MMGILAEASPADEPRKRMSTAGAAIRSSISMSFLMLVHGIVPGISAASTVADGIVAAMPRAAANATDCNT
jgi:hypothetical protein